MAILITGATGHLGPHLIAELIHTSDFDRLYVVARDAGGEQAALRMERVRRAADALLAARGVRASGGRVVTVDAQRFRSGANHRHDILRSVSVILHAAADTRFAAPLEVLRTTNVEGTREACRLAEHCSRLRQFLFVSTACVAGRRTGRIFEQVLDDSADFANPYERTKWEAEQIVLASGLPARFARLTTCAGSHVNGYVHRFGALHHLLHWMARGLVPMVPGSPTTPIDLISTDVAAAWLARACVRDTDGLDVCHVGLGDDAIPLDALVDHVFPLLENDGRKRLHRPLLVDEPVFRSFNQMVRLSGDALLGQVQESASAVLPSLLFPRIYDTTHANRCWGGPLPHPDWRLLLTRVANFGRAHRWGYERIGESCHV
jgi:thioester reductase-like protein